MKKILIALCTSLTLLSSIFVVSASEISPRRPLCPECGEYEIYEWEHEMTQFVECVDCIHGGIHIRDALQEWGKQVNTECPQCGVINQEFIGYGEYVIGPWAGC